MKLRLVFHLKKGVTCPRVFRWTLARGAENCVTQLCQIRGVAGSPEAEPTRC